MADLVAIQRAEGTRRVAVRAALTMGTALIALLAVDRVDWSIYATFGAFASIYGGGRPTPARPLADPSRPRCPAHHGGCERCADRHQ